MSSLSKRYETGLFSSMESIDVKFKDDSATFHINHSAQAAGPLQFVREFTQNGIEAVAALPDFYSGIRLVQWGTDRWSVIEEKTPKLSVLDTGVGMAEKEMAEYLSGLYSSGKEQGIHGNFGVGAKISALPYNSLGVIYTSLKDGRTARIRFFYDGQSRKYRATVLPPPQISELPEEIRQSGHGTLVTFLGNRTDENTTQKPPGTNTPPEGGADWVKRLLNSRYLNIPVKITVAAHRAGGYGSGNTSKKVSGARALLESVSSLKGSVKLPASGFTAHWWVAAETSGSEDGRLRGHTAAVYSGEIYEPSPKQSYETVKRCGIPFGYDKVVIYFELPTGEGRYSPDQARKKLTAAGEDLPWDDIYKEFRELRPKELEEYAESRAPRDGESDERTKKRVADILNRYSSLGFKRYSSGGRGGEGGGNPLPGSGDKGGPNTGGGKQPGTGQGGRVGPGGDGGGREVRTRKPPEVRFLDTDIPEDLAGRAAIYDRTNSVVQVNLRFAGIETVEKSWRDQLSGEPGSSEAIRSAIKSELEVVLVEAVFISSIVSGDRSTWTGAASLKLLEPEALTSAVCSSISRIDEAISKATRSIRTAKAG